MNTNYQQGLHILQDIAGDDLPCSIAVSSKSGHLINLFTSIRTGNFRSVYVRVISATGALSPASLVPDVTDNNQYDADLATIDGTDDFFVVWTSNAVGSKKRIYGRRFTLDSSGHVTATAASFQISQSNGDYVAPRVVYNQIVDKFFVTWVSVNDKEVQSIYLNNDAGTTAATYEGSLSDAVSVSYYSADLDLHNSKTLNISLLTAEDKVIAVYKNVAGNVVIFEYAFSAGKTPSAELLTTYEVASLGNFHFAYDEIHSTLKIVFTVSGKNPVYGDTISYFTQHNNKLRAGNPVQLNQSNNECARPFIKKTPVIGDSSDTQSIHFVVAWETGSNAIFFNVFDELYSQLKSEEEVNKGDSYSDNVRSVVTDSQIALVFQAAYFDGEKMSGRGLLYYVEDRTDN